MVMFINGPALPTVLGCVSVTAEREILKDNSHGKRYIRLKLGNYRTAKPQYLTEDAARKLRDDLTKTLEG